MTASNSLSITGQLIEFIDTSPTPWHAVSRTRQSLKEQNYTELIEAQSWQLKPNTGYFVVREEASLIAFRTSGKMTNTQFRIIGAHTDSPGLRIKPSGAQDNGGYLRLNCEVYGGPILATFTDRDLALAGRILVRDGSEQGFSSRLYNSKKALVRLPNLPIHLNRSVNDDGLKIHKHKDLNLLLSSLHEALPARDSFSQWLCETAAIEQNDLLGFELLPYDVQPGAFFGIHDEFIAVRQLDNLASCHAAITALLSTPESAATKVIALFDHEEVGSSSYTGADGSFLQDVLQRIVHAFNDEKDALAKAMAQSWLASADMAHAWHPSHSDCYDGLHHLKVNQGLALKINSSQRYATNAIGEALFMQVAEKANVPVQKYVHRADLSCGTTIGPVSAARLGIRTLDIGVPMWAMHSARESCGSHDQTHYLNWIRAFLSP
jgi:aspartyl aminopeptidase